MVYFCWPRHHPIPNCTMHFEIPVSCTEPAISCLDNMSSLDWRAQHSRMNVTRMLQLSKSEKIGKIEHFGAGNSFKCNRQSTCYIHGYKESESLWFRVTGSSLNNGNGMGELVGSTGLADAPNANSSSSSELGNVESASLTIAERRCVRLLIGTILIVVRVFVGEKSMPISDKVLSSFSLTTVCKLIWQNILFECN